MKQLLKLVALMTILGLTACGPQVGGHQQKNTMTGGGGGSDNDSNQQARFAENKGTRTETPPADGDVTGTDTSATVSTPTHETVVDTSFQPEAPQPAAEGGESTAGGFEKPEQGGDQNGFQADEGPRTDTPPPAGG